MDFALDLVFKIWILNFLFIFKVNGLQQFSMKPQEVSVIKGQTAVMVCSVDNRVGRIQWARNGLMLGYDRSIPGFPRYSVIGSNSQEFNLQITDVNLDDDTVFQCQVGPADNNPPLSAEAPLRVLVAPNMPVIQNHTNGSVIEVLFTQQVLQLTCIASNGRPAATLKWLRNGEEITDNVEYTTIPIENDKRENAKSVLTLSPKYPNDNKADYSCEAKNDALINGPLIVMVKLSVQYPPGKPVITGHKPNQASRTNDTIQMSCTSTGGNPLAQVVWFRNDKEVDYSYTHSQLDNKAVNDLTFTAKRSDNDANYRCEAWNVVNAKSHLVATRKLIVQFAPKTVTITGTREAKAGETLTLTCKTSNSNPAAVITWIPQGSSIAVARTNQEASPDGGFITISEIDVTLTHQQTSAIYTCSATNNELGITVADTATVGVLYPPDPPEIKGYQEGEAIRVGHVLRMTCGAIGGNPPATLAWYKGDAVLPVINTTVGNLPSLRVEILTKADDNGALYKCTATNRATDVPLEAVKKLTVNFPPASVYITSDPVNARAGQKLRLTCICNSSNPAADITWFHNNTKVNGTNLGTTNAVNGGKSSKNMLEIIPTPAHHEAKYLCRATNKALEAKTHDAITLNVLFKPVFAESLDIVILEGQSRVNNLTARANPSNSTYSLRRNGVVINTGDISSFAMDGGVLTVSGIKRDDGGFFTIIATNSEGITARNFTINVEFPAEIYEGNTLEGEVGGSAVLTCLARGNPMVPDMVTWTRDGFDMTRALPAYDNGVATLTIDGVDKADAGIFKCVADNEKGPAVTHDVELVLKFSPSIDKARELSKAASEIGRSGTLMCKAEGAPTVTFQWQKDGVTIVADDVKYKIQQKVDEENSLLYTNILKVEDVQQSDYGFYKCITTNEKGEDTFSIEFKDTTKPDEPYDIEFVNATHNSITVKWKGAYSGGPTQSFRVRYKEKGSNQGYVQVDVQPPDSNIFTVKGLSLGTEYILTVMAFNNIGGSAYQPAALTAKTSNLKPANKETAAGTDPSQDMPVIAILIICVVGIFLLALNLGLILFFVRKRRKRLENGSDTTSHTNTIELYGPSKETALYPMTPSDESRSYGTYDKNDDDFSDDYKSYEQPQHHRHLPGDDCLCLQVGKTTTTWKDNCCFNPGDDDLKRVFLPPPEYGGVTYSHNKLDSPTFDHRHPIHNGTELKYPYNGSDTDSCRKSPYNYEDPYRSQRGKGTFDRDYVDHHRENSSSGNLYEPNGRAIRMDTRPKSVAELSERSSRPSSRGVQSGHKTPPPPPVRSSSKGAADIPPLPARNYGSQEVIPRYVPPPGSMSSFNNNNVNVIANPSYEGPPIRTPSPRQPIDPDDDMRGHLV